MMAGHYPTSYSLFVLVVHVLACCFTAGYASEIFVPKWTAPIPDPSKPLAGLHYVHQRNRTELYHATEEVTVQCCK